MKVVCDGLSFSNAVSKVNKATCMSALNVSLACIRIVCKDSTMTLMATDHEIMITKRIKADVLIEGEVLVYAKFFNEFVKTLSNEQITLNQLNETQLKVCYGTNEAIFQCYRPQNFTPLALDDHHEKLLISQHDLKELISQVIFAVATDDTRQVLKGVLLEIEERTITAVALDGYRLALSRKLLEKKTTPTSLIISSKNLNEIARLLEDSDDLIEVMFHKRALCVNMENTQIFSVLMNGDFINYKQIIPHAFETEVVVNRKQFLEILERAVLVGSGAKMNLVRLDIKGDNMEISARSDTSSMQEFLDIKKTGENISIGFNGKYICDVLRATSDEFLKFKFLNPSKPCVITAVETEEKFTYLVLPMKL